MGQPPDASNAPPPPPGIALSVKRPARYAAHPCQVRGLRTRHHLDRRPRPPRARSVGVWLVRTQARGPCPRPSVQAGPPTLISPVLAFG
jgi:hypothetical protein